MPKSPPIRSAPTRDQVLAFIRAQSGDVSKRDIYRAFKVSAADKPMVRAMLNDFADEGLIGRSRKRRVLPAGTLPPVLVAEVIDLDKHGEPIGQPVDWQGDGPPPRLHIRVGRNRSQGAPGIGDRALVRLDDDRQSRSGTGRTGPTTVQVIRLLEQRPRRVVGVFRELHDGGRVVPTDRRARAEFHIPPGETGGARAGDLVVLESRTGRWLGLPQGAVVETLGPFDGPKAVGTMVLSRHDIPTAFPGEALAQAEKAKPPPLAGRVDLRDLALVTIDDEDARDFDDAVWAEADPAGGWHAVVAIADVAHFVPDGSPLDREARRRGNSVYLPDQVVPMLPAALSNGLCSLKPEADRACLAAHLKIGRDGDVALLRIERGIMRSAARLSYRQVQAARDGAGDAETAALIEPVITPLYDVYQALAQARNGRGALDLDRPERRVRLAENGTVLAIETRPRFDSHRLIEELMVATNAAVAGALSRKSTPTLYRVHDQPPLDRLEALRDYLSTFSLKLSKTGHILPIHFNQILKKAKPTPAYDAVALAVLRAQSQAEYSAENIGHFGLNLPLYTHFTSPIRRYADLIVHRAVIGQFGLGGDGITAATVAALPEIAAAISRTERRAADAERDAVDHYAARFMADRVGETLTTQITGVTRFGLFVTVPDSGATGLIPMGRLPERFRVDETGQRMIGAESGRVFALADSLDVTLAEADPITGSLRFDLEDGTAGSRYKAPRTHRKGRRPKRKPRR